VTSFSIITFILLCFLLLNLFLLLLLLLPLILFLLIYFRDTCYTSVTKSLENYDGVRTNMTGTRLKSNTNATAR
jgi:hypothetical protein